VISGFGARHTDSHPSPFDERSRNATGRNQQAVSEKVVHVDTDIVVIERQILWS
jgi:hypothetical protein